MAEKEGCLTRILKLFGATLAREDVQKPAKQEVLPYRVSDRFMSPAELSFYHALNAAVDPQQAVICPKVGLGDLFFVSRPRRSPEYRRYRNKIDKKHVDFVLCDPKTMRPLLAIELDDASHERADRIRRDTLVNRIFRVAGLPLLHVRVKATYNVEKMRADLAKLLAGAATRQSGSHAPIARAGEGIPICPKCGVPMTLRTAARGSHAGEQFYGCVNYPDCREVITAVEVAAARK